MCNVLALAQGVSSGYDAPPATDFVVMVSGDACTPCETLRTHLRLDASVQMPQLHSGWVGEGLALLTRRENVGMDFGAHNVRPVVPASVDVVD